MAEQESVVEQMQEPFLPQYSILSLGTTVVGHRLLGQLHPKKGRNATDPDWHSVTLRGLLESMPEDRTIVVETCVHFRGQLLHGCQTGPHGEGIGVEGPAMRNDRRLGGTIKGCHNVCTTSEGANWQAAADNTRTDYGAYSSRLTTPFFLK